jgi:hypothetical protein
MKETRGGALVTTIVGLILLMAAGGWLAGRGAWNRYQLRGLLRGAIEAYRAGDDRTAESLQSRAGARANLNALPPGRERDLYDELRAILVRRAYEVQLSRERQDGARPLPPDLNELRDLREECRRFRLPCPLVVEFVAALLDSRKLR